MKDNVKFVLDKKFLVNRGKNIDLDALLQECRARTPGQLNVEASARPFYARPYLHALAA